MHGIHEAGIVYGPGRVVVALVAQTDECSRRLKARMFEKNVEKSIRRFAESACKSEKLQNPVGKESLKKENQSYCIKHFHQNSGHRMK